MTFPDPATRPLLRPEELLEFIPGMGRSALYEAIRRDEIPSVKIGRRLYVPTAALRQAWALDCPEPDYGARFGAAAHGPSTQNADTNGRDDGVAA
jgi:predicted DNA-binding transcriptional regulator AlpA